MRGKKNLLRRNCKGYLWYFWNDNTHGLGQTSSEILELESIQGVVSIYGTSEYVVMGRSASSLFGKPLFIALRGFTPSINFELLIRKKIDTIRTIDVEEYVQKQIASQEIKKTDKTKLKQYKILNTDTKYLTRQSNDTTVIISETITIEWLSQEARDKDGIMREIGYKPDEIKAIVQSGYTQRVFGMKKFTFGNVIYVLMTNIITALVVYTVISNYFFGVGGGK